MHQQPSDLQDTDIAAAEDPLSSPGDRGAITAPEGPTTETEAEPEIESGIELHNRSSEPPAHGPEPIELRRSTRERRPPDRLA